jgi:two-component system cell cycle sensor histidine kinase PleC
MLGGRHDRQGLSLLQEYSHCVPGAAPDAGAPSSPAEPHADSLRANRFKSDFISHISHELRTPLNAMIGFSKLIAGHARHPLKDGEIVSYAEHINAAAHELLAFVNDVLELSKLQTGSASLAHDDVDVASVIAEIACDAAPKAHAGGVGVDVLHGGALIADADPVKLRRALAGLVDNAVRFTPPGGTVVVSAFAGRGQAIVEVRDTGVGMSSEEIALALSPFGSGDRANFRSHGGHGLGLPLARALIRAHGGDLEIASTPGEGTTVTVSLPLVHAVAEHVDGQNATLATAAAP